jgi:hypothetical protein
MTVSRRRRERGKDVVNSSPFSCHHPSERDGTFPTRQADKSVDRSQNSSEGIDVVSQKDREG